MEERIEEQAVAGGEEKTLEQLFSELEAVTGALEEESSLEKSFQLYHRGMDMLKACSDRIDRVEKQIQVLDEKGEAHELQ
ncbi:exodeoxyribonuclease VII small subunit [Lachnoclostridium sp. An118]|jgi:exodeoxyribonuclease VII small subunit|uniref:exodeoxyribonuclease VII small subunit n=1 Tax=Lachnoclostridium sp. An118 TaxID=1965547 RepID=UPI000B369DD5|nr:exodeoxyribonuclease VII small subunit [Lachnoclostridium sp. An118]OUQ52628.1 exodeoxyribonuclease VII small subunit [Lachnoclostridium sp. An118]HJA44146.1 exodeoxyribonuclease VII small subunit [Candidatus Dorea stercoravium]